MGAGSLLALMARHSLLPARQHFKLAPSDIALVDYERPSQVTYAQLAGVCEQPQPASKGALHQLLFSSFHHDLEERLQLLQLQGTGRNAHLNWLLDALASTLSTHLSLQSTFTAAADVSNRGASSAIKHRPNEVLHMLDVCTALRQVADDIERQIDCLQHSLQSVGQALKSEKSLSNGRLRAAAHRLSACLLQERPQSNVLCVASKQYRPLAEARSSLLLATKSRASQRAINTPLDPSAKHLSQALDGTMLTSLLALAAAVSSLEPPSRGTRSDTVTRVCKVVIKFLGACKGPFTPWVAPLRQLHLDLKQEKMSAAGGSLFREVQGLHSAATKVHATITTSGAHSIALEEVKQSVESLGKSLREMQQCILMLRTQMASLQQALIALRLTLLDS